ncbi:amidohydrolase family protein [Altererythrobacter arenosus]|uniref:Amidohydrolase family protein n=1 Tax=Altererythrobacter arenosus TaxID=3032592 RepID=A0ABY8FNQ5_9SPHN|nr:amidohydrolase family protein [Altererythrobacter sp. CAU 1644]WFL76417.1 amidohydrolase family protein [Altererythrobacter sp. CAU 1644]
MRASRLAALAPACLGLILLSACQSVVAGPDREAADLLITGGTVFDGSLADGRRVDVVVDDGRISFVGEGARARFNAAKTIVAEGLIVAPGFIDPHTHADEDLSSPDAPRRANLAFAFQGVSSVVIGNDGFGAPDIAEQAQRMRGMGVGTNVAFLAGFGPIREAAVGLANRAPTEAELELMKASVRKSMCEGAWGLSAGLYYVPQNYAATDEVVALASVAGALGGYYDTHMRDESTYNISVTGAVAETLEIGRRAGLPVHISHIKALGPEVWGKSAEMIALIEAAQESGQRVSADQYPWSASGTRISNALVPRWALEGGLYALRMRFDDPDQQAAIRSGIADGLVRRGGADKLLITGSLEGAEVETGKTLAEVARSMGLDPVAAAIAILKQGDARVASFNMSEVDIAEFAHREWVVTGSDGSSGHPRKYASFPKAFRDLVADGDMPLARFIRRSSAQTAEIVGLVDRGYLKPGYAADIVIFDAREFAPRASYQEPDKLSTGVRFLIVNGEPLISDGKYTGALPGLPLVKRTQC